MNEELANLGIWVPDYSGCFSSKSAFIALQQVVGYRIFLFMGTFGNQGFQLGLNSLPGLSAWRGLIPSMSFKRRDLSGAYPLTGV